jgi:hypothetical protein
MNGKIELDEAAIADLALAVANQIPDSADAINAVLGLLGSSKRIALAIDEGARSLRWITHDVGIVPGKQATIRSRPVEIEEFDGLRRISECLDEVGDVPGDVEFRTVDGHVDHLCSRIRQLVATGGKVVVKHTAGDMEAEACARTFVDVDRSTGGDYSVETTVRQDPDGVRVLKTEIVGPPKTPNPINFPPGTKIPGRRQDDLEKIPRPVTEEVLVDEDDPAIRIPIGILKLDPSHPLRKGNAFTGPIPFDHEVIAIYAHRGSRLGPTISKTQCDELIRGCRETYFWTTRGGSVPVDFGIGESQWWLEGRHVARVLIRANRPGTSPAQDDLEKIPRPTGDRVANGPEPSDDEIVTIYTHRYRSPAPKEGGAFLANLIVGVRSMYHPEMEASEKDLVEADREFLQFYLRGREIGQSLIDSYHHKQISKKPSGKA